MSTPPDYATHPEWLALVATICRDPADDLPRLVAADWLDEFDTPESASRAEYIRIGCELTRTPKFVTRPGGRVTNPDYERLHEREEELIEKNRRRYLEGSYPFYHRRNYEETRGFLFEIYATSADFIAHAAVLFASEPITRVSLIDRWPVMYWPTPLNLGQPDYLWASDGGIESSDPHRLPTAIIGAGPFSPHKTMTAAHEWLSRLCVDYGRKLAGLTPLPSPAKSPPYPASSPVALLAN